jgi:hypothetical protein
MNVFKKLVCVGTALTAMVACVGCGDDNSSYETAYDDYCKALLSFDAQKVVDMCPDSYIDYICENLYVEESDIVSAVNEYMIDNTDDIIKSPDYTYEFVDADEPEEVNWKIDFYLLNYVDDVETILYYHIFERQYPNVHGYQHYKSLLKEKYGCDDGNDISTLTSKIQLSVPIYPIYLDSEDDTKTYQKVKVNFKIDGEVDSVYCYEIDNKWYLKNLLEFIIKSLDCLDYGDTEYPEENKPTELQGIDANFEKLYSSARELYSTYYSMR